MFVKQFFNFILINSIIKENVTSGLEICIRGNYKRDWCLKNTFGSLEGSIGIVRILED